MPQTYLHVFVRSVGVVHLINFSSILQQVLPLIGKTGIVPAQLNHARTMDLGGNSPWIFFFFPSIYWFSDSDTVIVSSVVAGITAALSIVFCFGNSRLCLGVCWVVLLSLCSSGGEFFAFPWDWLLLEATFLSLFLPTLDTNGKLTSKVDLWVRHALIFLCLRFYSGMAVEKIPYLNNNPYWKNWTYLSRFYETEQPMPTWVAWYAHNLPLWFHQVCCLATFVLELLSPAMGLYRPLRNVGAVGMILFQIPIALTGNYAILNILTIVLCIPLFECRRKHKTYKDGKKKVASAPQQKLSIGLRAILVVHGIVGFMFLLRTIESLDYLSNTKWIFNENMYTKSVVSSFLPRPLLMFVSAWRLSNGYGGVFHDSFRHDGKIVLKLQGSADGATWVPIKWL